MCFDHLCFGWLSTARNSLSCIEEKTNKRTLVGWIAPDKESRFIRLRCFSYFLTDTIRLNSFAYRIQIANAIESSAIGFPNDRLIRELCRHCT